MPVFSHFFMATQKTEEYKFSYWSQIDHHDLIGFLFGAIGWSVRREVHKKTHLPRRGGGFERLLLLRN